MADKSDKPGSALPPPQEEYVVIARRYRPQRFNELLGQQHVGQALSNAIESSRVGHAYLFTGARGVGKTSAARILAKSLNCVDGPTPSPCNQCEMCLSIAGGDDVDVLEIDGASNRGIDEIRQLRQNVNIRPSRARFKIYIIDEVHMLTREAFNALLKTLEEPPEHVKFIFCTTEPTKIPITILSRCQRFDFAGISRDAIADRLRQIVAAEGVEAEPEALDLLARRAAGSMRDSQSLLEQLLAFSANRITAATVHAMLGTAGEDQILRLLEHLAGRNSAAALGELDAAVGAGVDVALLLEQLLGILRDAMAAAAGCTHETFLFVSASSARAVGSAAKRMGLLSILAAMQIVERALSHMRQSTQGRILAELALVRICYLEELDELPELIAQLRAGGLSGSTGPAAAPAGEMRGKKNVESALGAAPGRRAATAAASGPTVALSNENAAEVWRSALKHISVMAAAHGGLFDEAKADGPGRLVISFRSEYALAKSFCERPEHTLKFEEALKEVTGHPVRVRFAESGPPDGPDSPGTSPASRVSPQQRLKEVMDNPVVRRIHELFGATPLRVDGPDG